MGKTGDNERRDLANKFSDKQERLTRHLNRPDFHSHDAGICTGNMQTTSNCQMYFLEDAMGNKEATRGSWPHY